MSQNTPACQDPDPVSTQEDLQHQSSSAHPDIVDNRPQQAPIQLTLKELISMAPDIRKELCERLQAKPVPDEATPNHGSTTYHEPPPPPHVPQDDDDDDDYEAAVKALHQMDDEEPSTSSDDNNNNERRRTTAANVLIVVGLDFLWCPL